MRIAKAVVQENHQHPVLKTYRSKRFCMTRAVPSRCWMSYGEIPELTPSMSQAEVEAFLDKRFPTCDACRKLPSDRTNYLTQHAVWVREEQVVIQEEEKAVYLKFAEKTADRGHHSGMMRGSPAGTFIDLLSEVVVKPILSAASMASTERSKESTDQVEAKQAELTRRLQQPSSTTSP
jgi:hypothetical protein